MFKLNDKQMAYLEQLMSEDVLPVDENDVEFKYDCGGSCSSKCGGTCQAACRSSCGTLF